MLLNVPEHLYKYFNGRALLKDINFTVEDREAVGLIGINGCGKSTLLNIITGGRAFHIRLCRYIGGSSVFNCEAIIA